MLKFKLSKNPPPNSCLVGYYTGTDFNVDRHVALRDYSWEWPENRTGVQNRARCTKHGTPWDSVTSGDVVVGNISARRRGLTNPVPLPWGHRIGDNTLLGATELLLYNPMADGIDPTSEPEVAIAELKDSIRVLEYTGEVATDIIWDIDLVDEGGDAGRVDITGDGDYGWRIFLYLNKKTTRTRPLIVKYTGVETEPDSNNDLIIDHNVEELINPAPYITGKVVEPGTPATGSDGYVLELKADGSLRLVVNQSTTPANAMAIAFWSDRTDRQWRVISQGSNKDLEILDANTSVVLGVVPNIKALSIREIVNELNGLQIGVRATALIEYTSGDLELASATDITSYGSDPALMSSHLFVYYKHDTRVFLEKPTDISRRRDWHAIVQGSPIRYTVEDSTHPLYLHELTYNIGERAWLPYSEAFTSEDYLESVDEPAAVLDTRHISLRHENVRVDSIRLKINGRLANNNIEDYDKESGVLRLNRNIISAENIEISYAYLPNYKVSFDGINLNPGQLHLNTGYRLFFGFYIIPSKIVGPNGAVNNYSPNIGYIVANSAAEVIAATENITDGFGNSLNAKLLGIFQSNSQGEIEDVGIVDLRSDGGGVKEDVNLKELFKHAPEAQFFSDIGYWDGEPYAGSGVVVVQGPSRILGEDTSLPSLAAPSDGGFFDTTGRENIDDIRKRLKKHGIVGQHQIVDLE